MKIRFSAESAADLDSIFEYGVQQFGFARADRYLEHLIERIEGAAIFPLASKAYHGRRRAYRRIGYHSHFIYFRIADDTLDIVRVLHKRMSQSHHLR